MSTNKISWKSSAYPKYENYEQRLNTFERFWPISIRQNGMMMAKAEFFIEDLGILYRVLSVESLYTNGYKMMIQ